eukprot:15437638-Alexandrium_andersonii.AAC.1
MLTARAKLITRQLLTLCMTCIGGDSQMPCLEPTWLETCWETGQNHVRAIRGCMGSASNNACGSCDSN